MSTATAIEHHPSTRWTLNPDESFVEFTIKTFWGLTSVRGRFDRFGGAYETGPTGTKIALTVDADSLDTGNRKRDEHLRTEDFFHVGRHPRVRFVSTRVDEIADGVLHVTGELEAAGTVVQLEFPAMVQPVGGGLEIEAATTVDPTRFGMSRGHASMIRTPATIRVKARLERVANGG